MLSAFGVEHEIAKSGAAKPGMSRKEIRTGQALNVMAATGGGLALYHAGKRMHLARKGLSEGGEAPKWVGAAKKVKVLKPIAEHPKRALMATAGAAMGLHTAELVGDAISARSLHQQIKSTPKARVKKTYMGEGVFKPVTAMSVLERRAVKNGLKAKGVKQTAERKLPTKFTHKTQGKIRVTGYSNGKFIGVDSTDTKRMFGRDDGYFSKSMPKRVPDQISSMLPGSTVRAYDNSKRHKVRAASGNIGAKTAGAAMGGAVGVGLAAVAGKRLKPLQGATKIAFGGLKVGSKQAVKARKFTLTRDMKRGWAQSSIVGATAGATGGYAGNRQLKHVQRNKTYGYGR